MDPYPLALLCADRIITEAQTHKKSIIGTFNSLHARRFPAIFPPWFVYASFTNLDAGRSYEIVVAIDTLEGDGHLFEARAALNHAGRTDQVEIAIPVPQVRFPEPGSYRVGVSIEGRELLSRMIRVRPIPE